MEPTRPAVDLPVEGHMPSLAGASGWLNSPLLAATDLRGKVVLVNFWTYTCINWLRQLPYVRAWAERYKDHGLVVIGVHTPEFDVEHDLDNLRRAATDLRVDYPVAVDNDYAIWDAFANRYWPALYFAGADGVIRDQHFGEGRYEKSERVVQQLLGVDRELASVEGAGVEAAADWTHLRTPETYLGYARSGELEPPPGAVLDDSRVYTSPEALHLNRWSLAGEWMGRPE